MDKIAAGLERDVILTGAGGKRWHTNTINKILRNEKYIDDALLQKTYAGWNLPDWNAMQEPLTSQSFSMLSSRQSTRCLETTIWDDHISYKELSTSKL